MKLKQILVLGLLISSIAGGLTYNRAAAIPNGSCQSGQHWGVVGQGSNGAIYGCIADTPTTPPITTPPVSPPITTPPVSPPTTPTNPTGPTTTITCLNGGKITTATGGDYDAVCRSGGNTGWYQNKKTADAKTECEKDGKSSWLNNKCTTNTDSGSGDGGTDLNCSVLPKEVCNAAGNTDLKSSGVWKLLVTALNILTAGIGITAVGAIAWAGFLYASANDDSNKTKQAKDMIRNTAIGVAVYALMYVALQFLVPGGVFS